LAISGDGFFQVETGTANASGTTTFSGSNLYTRQGDFTLDKNGYIVNGSGYYLTGYNINSSTGAVDTSTTVPIQISALQNNPIPATTITYNANLPQNAAVGFVASTSSVLVYDSYGNTHSANYTWSKTGANTWNLNVSIPDGKDANGNPYNANIPFTFNNGSTGTTGTISAMGAYAAPTAAFTVNSATATGTFTLGTGSTASSFLISQAEQAAGSGVSASINGAASAALAGASLPADGTASAANVATNIAYIIGLMQAAGATGAPATATASGTTVTMTTPSVSVTPDAGGLAGGITWAANSWAGPSAAVDGTTAETAPSTYGAPGTQTAGLPASASINVTFGSGSGATTQALSLNFGSFGSSSGVTQFADSNSSVTVSAFSQDGLPKGSFNSVEIDKNGFVSLNYSNGTNKKINQIPIALFYAEDQLQRISGGAFQATEAAGTPRLVDAGSAGSGTISSSSLEQSNVDISTEFTNLIKAQQVYTANTKVVTTDNQLLQATINMVQ